MEGKLKNWMKWVVPILVILAVLIVGGVIIVNQNKNQNSQMIHQEREESQKTTVSDGSAKTSSAIESNSESRSTIGSGTVSVKLPSEDTNNTKELEESDQEDDFPITIDTEDYFNKNSEVLKVVNASDSEGIQTENEVGREIGERGFTSYPITYDYTEDGEILAGSEVKDSPEKHPYYYTYYVSSKGDIWTISSVNGTVTAYPVSYNSREDVSVPVIISEQDYVVSYDVITKKYFETIPKETVLLVKRVERIDSDLLEELTAEVIDAL